MKIALVIKLNEPKFFVICIGILIIEELLEGFWCYMIGNMIAVFFVLCQILGKLQHWQIRYMKIINFSYFVW